MCVPPQLSLQPHCCCFFAELRVQRNPDGPRLAVVTREDSCFCVYRFELLQLRSQHKQAPEARWAEWSGGVLEWDDDGVGSTLSGLDGEAANDSTVTGSRSRALFSASPVPFFPLLPHCL